MKKRHSRSLFSGGPEVRRGESRLGSAMVMAIVLSVVITALVLVTAWTASGLAQSAAAYGQLDRAYFVAEGAAQQAYWRYKKNNSWRAAAGSPLTGSNTVDGHTYNYSVTCVTSGSGVLITSTANDGAAQSQVHMTLVGGAPPAALAIAGNLTTTSQMIMNGDLVDVNTSNMTTSGTFQVNGNLTTNAPGAPGGVSGVTTKNAGLPSTTIPLVSNFYTTLATSAANATVSSGTISVLDFTLNPVLKATGNITIASGVVIIGSGTLIVSGNLKTGGDLGTSTAAATINLLATGNFTATNKYYVNGSLYAGGDIQFNNQTVLTGAIVANGNVGLNNHHTFNYSTPPSFDPRGAIVATGYGGALP